MKNYVADFETTSIKNYEIDKRVRVWAYCVRDIETLDIVAEGTDIADFLKFCEKETATIYFHNLKFDGSFIIYALLSNGWNESDKPKTHEFSTLISDKNQWYSIKCVHKSYKKRKIYTEFRDSLKKLPFSEKIVAKTFGLPCEKGEIDYTKYRPAGYVPTDFEWAYIRNDTEIIARALKIQFDQGLDKMTIGADCMEFYKNLIGKRNFDNYFPLLSFSVDEYVRKAYRGGYVYVNPKYKSKELHGVGSYDVNSLYPAVMHDELMPYGNPVFYRGRYKPDKTYPLYVQRFYATFTLKEGHVPTVQKKHFYKFAETEYIVDSGDEPIEFVLSCVDLELFLEHYDVHSIEYIDGYMVRGKYGLFSGYIDYWYSIKCTTNDIGMRTLAKLYLNNLYGKFGKSPVQGQRHPKLLDGVLKFELDAPEITKGVYIFTAVFTCSYGHKRTIDNIMKIGDAFVYADTDSNKALESILDKSKMDIDPIRLGAWKYEGTYDIFTAHRPKTYVAEIESKVSVTCAGMPDTIKRKINSVKDFKIGSSWGDKLICRQVVGGCLLVETFFTLKG